MPRRNVGVTSVKTRIQKYRDGSYYARAWKGWVDPFPEVHGTLPEKMVYAKLTTMGIPFYFLNDIQFSLPEADFFKEYQADFIIPTVKVIIEVQGAVWHSKPAAIEADAFKLAVYESFGYKALAWWDFEIMSDLDGLFAKEPLLLSMATSRTLPTGSSTELTPIKRTKVDTSQGIRTLNQKFKFKAYKKSGKIGRRTLRKATSSYGSR